VKTSEIALGDLHALAPRDFERVRKMLHQAAGIELGPEKHALVLNRLQKRVRALRLRGFRAYVDLILDPEQGEERQRAVDLLTTNETFFFREPAHFKFLAHWLIGADRPGHPTWRVWSAASSSGEEAYSIAMTMAATLGSDRWEVLGSDISRRVLERARIGHYPLVRMEEFPLDYLRRYCLKGQGPQDGTLLIDKKIRNRVTFQAINFMEPLPPIGTFHAVFLRNALIYFKREEKQIILRRVEEVVKPGGFLFVSHSESLFGLAGDLELVKPSIYRKPG
jgi:chemotaxis protein methyltransferase CheR